MCFLESLVPHIPGLHMEVVSLRRSPAGAYENVQNHVESYFWQYGVALLLIKHKHSHTYP